jgi:hypothetical protein
MHLAETIHRERLAEAAQERQRVSRSVTIRLSDRLRQAFSARLISWGEQLQSPTPRMAER